MKRRKILQAAIAGMFAQGGLTLPGHTLAANAPGRFNMRNRAKTYLRAEPRPSDTAPSGAFASREVDGLLFLTNAYGYSYEIPLDSYIEWHIDSVNTYLKFRCVNSDQYRVKAFPCAVLGTMGGRYETSGNPQPLKGMENEFRMKGEGMQSPLFDLYPAQQQTGFPCKLKDLPDTSITVKTSYSGSPTVNTFLDMYLHDIDTAQTASHPSLLGDINAMNSNRTKAYNINVWFQMPDKTNGNTDRPDGAWAGGKVMGTTTIGSREFHVILKIETGGGNYFRYVALIPVNGPITALSVNEVMDWAQRDMRPILDGNSQAKEMMGKADPRGLPAPRWPDQNMVLSGLHIGNEIWWSDPNGQEGIVKWPKLRVDVKGKGSFGWGEPESASLSNTPQWGESVAGKQEFVASANAISIDPADAKLPGATSTPEPPPKKKGFFNTLIGAITGK